MEIKLCGLGAIGLAGIHGDAYSKGRSKQDTILYIRWAGLHTGRWPSGTAHTRSIRRKHHPKRNLYILPGRFK